MLRGAGQHFQVRIGEIKSDCKIRFVCVEVFSGEFVLVGVHCAEIRGRWKSPELTVRCWFARLRGCCELSGQRGWL